MIMVNTTVPVNEFKNVDEARQKYPLPELGGVQDEQDPVQEVQHVAEVEHLKIHFRYLNQEPHIRRSSACG